MGKNKKRIPTKKMRQKQKQRMKAKKTIREPEEDHQSQDSNSSSDSEGDETAIRCDDFEMDGPQVGGFVGDAGDSDDNAEEGEEEAEDDDGDFEDIEEGEDVQGSAEPEPEPVKDVHFPQYSLMSKIKNKLRRREVYMKYKAEKNKEKRETRKQRLKEYAALGDDAPPKQVPRTIENTREPDEMMVDPEDEEVREDEAVDEMASYFRAEKEPKVLITTSDNPHVKTIKFCRELKQTIPNAEFRWRNRSAIKKICRGASARGYTDIMVVNENVRRPNGLLHVHLPNGPTAFYKLSTVRYCKDIKHRARYSAERPEVIINHFNTRLGHTVGRMLACLFHYDPQFHGRRVVTWHNQRDYIFFRHHRYEFKNGERVALQEIGPRFTLKLRWLQNGTFDTKYGEYEWILKRHEMLKNRRTFVL
jgi:ribosome production factor 1